MHRKLALAALVVVLVCGCSNLPDSGQVHTRPVGSRATNNQASYFAPPGPNDSDNPESIVRGFLLAMQANPPSVAVARSFLSRRAKATWKPNEGTIVYDGKTVESVGNEVAAQLRESHRLSPSGMWLDGTDATTTTMSLNLVQEDGKWRIDDPPNLLAVPATYFSSLFVPFNLYFFDRTGSVLVPTKVYMPQAGETATASNLVRGLLAGPSPAQHGVAVTKLPSHTDLDLGVEVSDTGTAEVPLDSSVLRLAPADLSRLVSQLAWVLRQVPGINRLQIVVDGAPVPLASGRTEVSVDEGAEYDPLVSSERDLVAISGRRVVLNDGTKGSPIAGPFGETGFSLRSLAWSPRGHVLAAVSGSGRRVFEAPDRGARTQTRARTVLDGATDVLRPAYDRFGGLWLLDRSGDGAVVHLIRNRHDHVIPVAGVSGRQISAFTVTSDGTSLVAVLANGANPTIQVSGLVRASSGRLKRALPARTLRVSDAGLGPARDVAQNGATTVAVLTRPAAGAGQVLYVELDGSPGLTATGQGSSAPETVPGALDSLVASPDPVLALRVVSADRHMFSYSDAGWTRAQLVDVIAAAYPQ